MKCQNRASSSKLAQRVREQGSVGLLVKPFSIFVVFPLAKNPLDQQIE